MSAVSGAVRKTALTTWEGIWYILQCIAFGAGHFAKVPVKKASDVSGKIGVTFGVRQSTTSPFGTGASGSKR